MAMAVYYEAEMENYPSANVEYFEVYARKTDQLDEDIETPILGLLGEVGGVVSAIKKKRRDNDGFFGYREAVIEELGDVLWYAAAVARRGGTSLAEIIARAAGMEPDAGALRFSDLQNSHFVTKGPLDVALLELASEAGDLAKRFAAGSYRDNTDALRGDLIKFVRPLARAAIAADINLDEAAEQNTNKTQDRWPIERTPPPPIDDGCHIDEQIPREMRVLIYEREINGSKFVFQKSGGILLGDRLTDNYSPPDDYRFHDVFHLAHAAVLGWSPTTRALLKIKRKSNKRIDENEDGARANIIEEGLTTWIFETAKEHRFFANTQRLGLDILKSVKRFVRGYEAEKLPMWLWEEAILQGYAAFRMLQLHRCGVIRTDLKLRKIWYEPMTDADLIVCGLKQPPEHQ